MNWMKKIIIFLRNIRVKMNISPIKLLPLLLYNLTHAQEKIIQENLVLIKNISFLDSIRVISKKYNEDLCIKEIIDGAEILIPIIKMVNKQDELKRLQKEEKKLKTIY